MKKVSQTSLTPTIFHQSHKIFWPTLDLLPIMKRQDISQSMLFLFKKFFKLKYSWFAMIQVYSKVIQLYTHTHIYIYIYIYIYVWIWSGPFAASSSFFPCCSGCFWTPKTRHPSPTTSLLSEGKKSSPHPTRWASFSPQGSILAGRGIGTNEGDERSTQKQVAMWPAELVRLSQLYKGEKCSLEKLMTMTLGMASLLPSHLQYNESNLQISQVFCEI